MIAGIAGAVLLISLFLSWYSFSLDEDAIRDQLPPGVPDSIADQAIDQAKAGLGDSSASGWTALSFIDILLLLVAAIAIAVAVLRMANALPRLSVSPGLIVLAAGVLAVLLVIFRIIDIPTGDASSAELGQIDKFGGLSRDFGIFIALLAAAGVAVGGWLGWNEEGKPMPSGAGSGGAPAGGPAIGGGQPAGGFGGGQPAATAPPAATQAQPAATVPPAQASAPASGQGQPADWYPDPRGEKRLRYWDGTQWTEHTAD
jgi:hypothetical protein